VRLGVKEGDHVEPGTIIGEISQDDLRNAILEAESTLKDLQVEDLALTQIEENNRKSKQAEMARPNEDNYRAQNDASEKTKMAGREAESEQDQAGTEASRQRAQLECRRKIRQLETKLALDGDAMVRKSRIVSRFRGQVAQVLSARDTMVREGSPIVVLHVPRGQGADRRSEPQFDAIVLVPGGAGKKIDGGCPVEIVPATVERAEHGFIRGNVTDIAQLPASKNTLEEALGNPEQADEFLKQYPREGLLIVKVELRNRANPDRVPRRNRFDWSTATGSEQPLKTGTMCQAAIVIESPRLITLIIPWSKRILGAD
jgi:HlyD family secretion protein